MNSKTEKFQIKKRDSNLELYRILVMFLIVCHHFVVNSGVLEKMYDTPLSFNSIFLFLFGAWGKTGINCYMMITGYFMCKSYITIEKYIKLLAEILFYNIIISTLFFVFGYGGIKDIINAFLIVRNIDSSNFIACFLIFYLLIPFINILLKNIDQKQHIYLLAVLAFLYVILGTLPKFSVTMNYVSWFSFLYLVAAYIRFYPIKNRKWGMWTLIFILVGILSVFVCIILGEKLDKKVAYRFVSDSNTFIAFMIGVCSFMFFKKLKIKYNKVINIIGGSTFGVLCIHANSNTMRQWLWKTILDVKGHYEIQSYKLIIYSFASVFTVFVVCVVIDIIRKKFLENFFMDKIVNTRVFNKVKKGFQIV